MKNLSKVSQLFDIYHELLSKKQCDYIKDYYFNDFSLSEMSNKYNISRAAIHYSIKNGVKDLQKYENKLKFLSLQKERLKIYNEIKDENIRLKLINHENDSK